MVSIKSLKTLKYHTFLKKKLLHSIICSTCGSKDEKIFKGKEPIEIFKINDLIINIEEYQNKYN